MRESPDGENSSKCILAGAELAESGRNSTACGIGEITEEEVAENRKQGEDNKVEGPRDVIREYVLQEEEKIAKRKAKLPLKFKDLKPVSVAKNRAKLNTQRKQWRPMRSMSTDKLLESKKTKSPTLPKMGTMGRHSMERLPTLSAFDEERIVWLKNLEDDICMEEERRARSQLRQNQQNLVTDSASSSAQSSPSTCISRGTSPYNRLQRNKLSSIKKKMPPDAQLDKIQHELSVQNEDQDVKVIEGESKPQSFDQEDAVQEPQEPQIENEGAELKEVPEVENEKQKVVETSSSSNNTLEDQVKRKQLRRSLKKKERELAEERRRSKSRKKYPPLSAECFLVSRGWQLDQTRLLRALDRLKVANFGRVQLATTINRVVESIRPHLDAVIIHIGNQELIEAAYSVVSVTETGENMRDTAAIGLSVAGSVATVMCRHIITAANQNRATQFVVSLPLPVSLAKSNFEADIHYTELRRMFNATMKANCQTCPNIQCCENENLLSSGNNLPPLKPKIEPAVAPNCTPIKQCSFEAKPNTHEYEKYILDNHQVTAAGMRKLARNWENCLNRIDRASDGQLMLRRSSDSSEANTSTISTSSAGDRGDPVGAIENDPILQNGGGDEKQQRSGSASSSGGSRSTDSLETRAPWKP